MGAGVAAACLSNFLGVGSSLEECLWEGKAVSRAKVPTTEAAFPDFTLSSSGIGGGEQSMAPGVQREPDQGT